MFMLATVERVLSDRLLHLPVAPAERSMMAWTTGCGAMVVQKRSPLLSATWEKTETYKWCVLVKNIISSLFPSHCNYVWIRSPREKEQLGSLLLH